MRHLSYFESESIPSFIISEVIELCLENFSNGISRKDFQKEIQEEFKGERPFLSVFYNEKNVRAFALGSVKRGKDIKLKKVSDEAVVVVSRMAIRGSERNKLSLVSSLMRPAKEVAGFIETETVIARSPLKGFTWNVLKNKYGFKVEGEFLIGKFSWTKV